MSREIDRRTMLRLSAATATLENITVGTSTADSSAQFIGNLVVDDVTVGGAPVKA
jgi:hypothetical protein